jgi:galactonate dehydratase
MRITDIRTHPVQAAGRTFFIVTVHTDEGLVGIGEAGLQRRWRAVDGAIEHLKLWLIGQDPSRIQYLWQRMWRGGFYPADRTIGSAISAIDIALWDIKGKTLGVPVYQLLGGRCRDHVEVFTSPGYLFESQLAAAQDLLGSAGNADPDATAEMARMLKAKGIKYFRLGMPSESETFCSRTAIQQSLRQFRAVRDAVGSEMALMIDVHARLSLDEAVYFCRQLEALNMFVVEDPIRSDHPLEYGRLRAQTSVPLGAGEQWCGKSEFRPVIENNWIDFVRLDVCIAGGISEALKVAAMAESHGSRMLFHNPLGPVCAAASLHLDLALENAGPQEVIYPPDVLPDVFQCDFKLSHGTHLTVPSGPGLGISFDANAALRFPGEMTEPPHFHRPDGSFTNY